MSDAARRIALAALLLLVVSALTAYVLEGPSWRSLVMALFLILLFTPVKGVVYRRLGGGRPYASALAANASSQLTGLPFHLSLALSFWPLFGVSFFVSAAIETLALVALGTVSSLSRSLVLAFYGSLVVHLLSAGFLASFRSLALGIAFLLAGVVLFHVPTFFPDEWVASSSSSA